MFILIKRNAVVFIITMVSFFWGDSFAQSEYIMSLSNGVKVNDHTIEFDVFIRSTLSSFVITSYQCAFYFNQAIVNNGTLSLILVPGTSDLTTLIPATAIGLMTSNGSYQLTFASLPGEENISTKIKRIGRFRLENSNSFASGGFKIKWGFDRDAQTILTGSSFLDITKQSNHVYNVNNIGSIRFPIIDVFASSTSDESTSPEGTIDGYGFYDSVQTARWATEPMPQWIQFDLGAERQINQTKFSFYNFQVGRIYQYSVSISNDRTTWNEVITNASSSTEEWTTDTFEEVSGRYIRLDFLSSTNNPQNWANLWEAEIWGTVGVTSNDEFELLPENFSLNQNYPNPFNPSTTITFSLPEKSHVSLVIFNLLGEKVMELLDGNFDAGNHSIDFDASGLSSGIYFYRLAVPNKFFDVRKMVLIK